MSRETSYCPSIKYHAGLFFIRLKAPSHMKSVVLEPRGKKIKYIIMYLKKRNFRKVGRHYLFYEIKIGEYLPITVYNNRRAYLEPFQKLTLIILW